MKHQSPRHIALLVTVLMLFGFGTVRAGDCLSTTLPIGEKDLLEPAKRWTTIQPLTDTLRTVILSAAGYADSTGKIQSGLVTKIIDRCPYTYGGSNGIELLIVFIGSKGDDKDENVYLVTMKDGNVIARSLIAQLQTSCTTTFLRGCTLLNDGTIHVQQLEHTFDCDSDEFKGTNKLPAFIIGMRDDGAFEETLIETPPISDGE
jgi:hypothetical protein